MTSVASPSTKLEITSDIGPQLKAISTMPITELWTLWDKHFKIRPQHPNRRQIEARLRYRLQEMKFGGLNPDTRNLLADFGERLSKIKTSTRPITALLPGTVLIREFDGRDYHVTVATDGRFEMDGHKYPSLSAVAKHITGTQWSGPAFFGLNKGTTHE